MPNLQPTPLYNGSEPYFFDQDNIPLKIIDQNFTLLNDAVDSNTSILEVAQGSAGNLATRLNESLNPDGSLQTQAVNNTMHLIDDHTDSSNFVRMQLSERNKLASIASGATNINFQIDTISNTISYPNNSVVSITGSSTIDWTYTAGVLKANAVYPPTQKYYSVVPHTTDNQHFTTTIGGTAFISGTLRVYINGMKVNESPLATWVPTDVATSIAWVSMSYTEINSSVGTFMLNVTLDGDDVITIDFDHEIV